MFCKDWHTNFFLRNWQRSIPLQVWEHRTATIVTALWCLPMAKFQKFCQMVQCCGETSSVADLCILSKMSKITSVGWNDFNEGNENADKPRWKDLICSEVCLVCLWFLEAGKIFDVALFFVEGWSLVASKWESATNSKKTVFLRNECKYDQLTQTNIPLHTTSSNASTRPWQQQEERPLTF